MWFRVCGAVGALVVSSGAVQARSEAAVASGPPQTFFAMSTADALGKIAKGCMDDAEPVTAREGNAVVCEIPMGTPERIAARVVLREPFVRWPRAFVRFTVAPNGTDVSRVQVSGWVEDSRPLPGRRTVSLAGASFDKQMRAFLSALGGSVRPA